MQILRRQLPFRLQIPFFVVGILFYGSILLYVLFLRVIYLYGWLLCAVAWFLLPRAGKDILAVHDGTQNSAARMSELEPLFTGRTHYLNYDDRKKWDRWSLPILLFYQFGPKPIPEFFMPHSLPAVIVFRKFHMPKLFTFGDRTKEPEKKLEQLRSLICPPHENPL